MQDEDVYTEEECVFQFVKSGLPEGHLHTLQALQNQRNVIREAWQCTDPGPTKNVLVQEMDALDAKLKDVKESLLESYFGFKQDRVFEMIMREYGKKAKY